MSQESRIPPVRVTPALPSPGPPQAQSQALRPPTSGPRPVAGKKSLPAPLTQPYNPLPPSAYLQVSPQYPGVHGSPGGYGPAGQQTILVPVHPYPAEEDRTLWWLLFSFEGRIPRRTYWAVHLSSIAATTLLSYLFIGLMVFAVSMNSTTAALLALGLGMLAWCVLLVPTTWIGIAVLVKRWHDLNKPGEWALIALIPIAGPIWILVECGCTRGTYGPNLYGPDPT